MPLTLDDPVEIRTLIQARAITISNCVGGMTKVQLVEMANRLLDLAEGLPTDPAPADNDVAGMVRQ